jgi:hypothetical protein
MNLAEPTIFSAIADNIWILIPLTALMIPIVAIALEPLRDRMRQAERREARQAYERLMQEKLDILKTGIAMGYTKDDLRELDARLEKLIGQDKLKTLLDPKGTRKLEKEIRSIELEAELESATSSAGQSTVKRIG